MNSNLFIGNVGTDPILRAVTVEGKATNVATFRMMVTDPVLVDGNVTEGGGGYWVSVSCWDKRAEGVAKHVRKGARMMVYGKLRQSSWIDEVTKEERNWFGSDCHRAWVNSVKD